MNNYCVLVNIHTRYERLKSAQRTHFEERERFTLYSLEDIATEIYDKLWIQQSSIHLSLTNDLCFVINGKCGLLQPSQQPMKLMLISIVTLQNRWWWMYTQQTED